jgi:hypothetical protein
MGWELRLDRSGSEYGKVVGFCEGGDELSDTIKWEVSHLLAEETGGSRAQFCSTEVVILFVS